MENVHVMSSKLSVQLERGDSNERTKPSKVGPGPDDSDLPVGRPSVAVSSKDARWQNLLGLHRDGGRGGAIQGRDQLLQYRVAEP